MYVLFQSCTTPAEGLDFHFGLVSRVREPINVFLLYASFFSYYKFEAFMPVYTYFLRPLYSSTACELLSLYFN